MKSAKAIFFDFEVFKYDWLVCITEYWLDDDKNIKTKDLVILNNRIQLIDYYRENKDKGIFIGKNSSRYDNGIMVGIIEGKDPKGMSDKIIEKDIKDETVNVACRISARLFQQFDNLRRSRSSLFRIFGIR